MARREETGMDEQSDDAKDAEVSSRRSSSESLTAWLATKPADGRERLAVDAAAGASAGYRRPWLFQIAKDMGYVTWFGEEFCAQGAQWGFQGHYLDYAELDYTFHSLY
eukprot:282402-Rhodomonas_salina.1